MWDEVGIPLHSGCLSMEVTNHACSQKNLTDTAHTMRSSTIQCTQIRGNHSYFLLKCSLCLGESATSAETEM